MLIASPSLWMGYSQDDHIFRLAFQGAPDLHEMQAAPWNTYCFSDGDPERITAMMNRGVFPWWTAPEWRVNFFRPIAALSIYCDFLLFGDSPFFMHLHSVLLFGLLVAAVALLYCRVMTELPKAFLWAALFYALCGGHGIPVAWISHRNSLYAVLFATLSLLAHIEWRRASCTDRRKSASYFLVASLALYAMALFSAELAFGFLGYFAAYSLFLDERNCAVRINSAATLIRRFFPLGGIAAIITIWLCVYLATGHGAKGSWFYIDPSKDPLHFFAETMERYPVLLFGLLSGVDSLLYMVWPQSGQWLHMGIALSAIAFVAWATAPLLRVSAHARFWAFGAATSLAPICAAMPSNRLLQTSAIGGLAFMAIVITGIRVRASWIPSMGLRRTATIAMAPWFLAASLVVSPIVFITSMVSIGVLGEVEDQLRHTVPAESGMGRHVIVMNAPLDVVGIMPPFAIAADGESLPESWLCLHAGPSDIEVERIDEQRLRVTSADRFVNRPCSQLFRDPVTHPFRVGDEIILKDATVTVERVAADGRPESVVFQFDKALSDPSWTWLAMKDSTYVTFEPPAIGSKAVLHGLDLRVTGRIIAHAIGRVFQN